MASEAMGTMIGPVVVLMGAAVVAVPLFRRLGLGTVLGYFAAGMLVGPSVLGIFTDPASILHFSELGVVMFLFIIGLELRPQKLWAMRGQIFGLGLAQVFACIALLSLASMVLFQLPPAQAFVAGAGFVMSSTAVIMSMLQERGELTGADGQKDVSILLFEDLMIVPLLAVVAFLSPLNHEDSGFQSAGISFGAVVLLIVAGRYLLDPFFALIARARTREVLSAGALLVVLGSALLMESAGLSMAMGSFMAGVMLSGSSYRHQIESDIEPFRGLLMGLFFLAVGMSLDLQVVLAEWPLLLAMLAVFVGVKAIGIYGVARLFGASNLAALRRTSIFAQGGEFAFVLYAAALGGGVISARENAILSTVIILSMALTPLVLIVADRLLQEEKSLEGVEPAFDLKGQVLMIGFGRFGQIASQLLLLRGIEVSIIESNPDRIREAERFGFKIYYGDGTRLDILQHSGAIDAEVIMVCTDDRRTTSQIVELVLAEFPLAKVLVRSYDRAHSMELRRMGVDYDIRETVESAYQMGGEGLRAMGVADARAAVSGSASDRKQGKGTEMTTILGLAGSLRRASFNRGLLRAAAEVASDGITVQIGAIDDVPLYHGDHEDAQGLPPAVSLLQDQLRDADALLLVTPEYNGGIPGVFKNTIDWMSRGEGLGHFRNKPVAVIGASPGGFGTVLSQNHWLQVLRKLGMQPWFGGQMMVSRAGTHFDADGNLTDEDLRVQLGAFLDGFAASHKGKPR